MSNSNTVVSRNTTNISFSTYQGPPKSANRKTVRTHHIKVNNLTKSDSGTNSTENGNSRL